MPVRDLHACVFARDCSRILNQLQSGCSWHVWACSSQLSSVFLPTVKYVLSIRSSNTAHKNTANLFAALNYLGVPTEFDPNDGSSAGAAFVPTDLDPINQTRSDARRTYFDPYLSRPNFHVITGQHVTRVLVDGVESNFAISNPTPGGNENGNGMNGMASNEGFGFGPEGSTPALNNDADSPPGRLFRRQSPSTSNLRITGVEVRLHPW